MIDRGRWVWTERERLPLRKRWWDGGRERGGGGGGWGQILA